MNTEELLKPRYKVIADWPRSDFKVGEVLSLTLDKEVHFLPFCLDKHGYYWYGRSLEKYPHLFKKLEWWEDRKPEDIEYVKWSSSNSGTMWIAKILEIKGDQFKGQLNDGTTMHGEFTPGQDLPATQEEYEQSLVTNS